MVVVAAVALAAPVGWASAEPLQRSSCTREGVSREVELRMAAGIEGICDVIDRRPEEGTEERTLHVENGQGSCRARFDDRVRALRRAGWQCTDVGAAGVAGSAPARTASEAAPTGAPFAERYRERCEAALEPRYAEPKTICSCAVRTMNDAGFTEGDYELLSAPHGDGEGELPVHAAGLLYGLGMIAVDALERCGARP